jgi:large subunit ribosomal protein L15
MPLINLKRTVRPAKRKIVGRGNSSGHGTYSCRGGKGQTARSGGTRRPGFEGGQMPFVQKIPKNRGFKNPCYVDYKVVNVCDLEKLAKLLSKDGKEINLSNPKSPFKLLGHGEVKQAYKIKTDKASKEAIAKIEKAGGSVELIMIKSK